MHEICPEITNESVKYGGLAQPTERPVRSMSELPRHRTTERRIMILIHENWLTVLVRNILKYEKIFDNSITDSSIWKYEIHIMITTRKNTLSAYLIKEKKNIKPFF